MIKKLDAFKRHLKMDYHRTLVHNLKLFGISGSIGYYDLYNALDAEFEKFDEYYKKLYGDKKC